MFRVGVLATAGPTGERQPLQIDFGTRQVQVAEVLDRWFGEGYCYFKVKGSDSATYVLRHDEQAAVWEIALYLRQDGEPESRPPPGAARH